MILLWGSEDGVMRYRGYRVRNVGELQKLGTPKKMELPPAVRSQQLGHRFGCSPFSLIPNLPPGL